MKKKCSFEHLVTEQTHGKILCPAVILCGAHLL